MTHQNPYPYGNPNADSSSFRRYHDGPDECSFRRVDYERERDGRR